MLRTCHSVAKLLFDIGVKKTILEPRAATQMFYFQNFSHHIYIEVEHCCTVSIQYDAAAQSLTAISGYTADYRVRVVSVYKGEYPGKD